MTSRKCHVKFHAVSIRKAQIEPSEITNAAIFKLVQSPPWPESVPLVKRLAYCACHQNSLPMA